MGGTRTDFARGLGRTRLYKIALGALAVTLLALAAAPGRADAAWSLQTSGDAFPFYAVTCVDNNTCWAGDGQGGIRATVTGGLAWSPQAPGTLFVDGFSCVDTLHCWVVGYAGFIGVTSTGGAAWTPQTSNTSNTLKGIKCPSATRCYAVGLGGTIPPRPMAERPGAPRARARVSRSTASRASAPPAAWRWA